MPRALCRLVSVSIGYALLVARQRGEFRAVASSGCSMVWFSAFTIPIFRPVRRVPRHRALRRRASQRGRKKPKLLLANARRRGKSAAVATSGLQRGTATRRPCGERTRNRLSNAFCGLEQDFSLRFFPVSLSALSSTPRGCSYLFEHTARVSDDQGGCRGTFVRRWSPARDG